jgi:hypothetical protein
MTSLAIIGSSDMCKRRNVAELGADGGADGGGGSRGGDGGADGT